MVQYYYLPPLIASPTILSAETYWLEQDGLVVVVVVVVHGGAARPGHLRAARRFRPDAGLLQHDLPEPGEHRARRGDAEEGRHRQDDRLHRPPLLPRLLRRGLRRIGADRLDVGEPGSGEGRRRQQVPGVRRLRHGERRQGRRGGGLPRHGVLRRRTHHRHARRHRPERRSVLPGGAGQAGRAELQRQQRHRPAAASQPHHEPAGRDLQSTRAHHVPHGRSLSGAHRGAGALRQVQRPVVRQPGGRDAEPQVRGVPQERVPRRRRRVVQPDGAHGPGHAGGVRQPVLPEPAGRRRPARLRPAALHRQPHPPERRRVGQQHGRLQQGLRRRHHQARPRRGQVRQPGQHTHAVRCFQLMEPSIDKSDRLMRIYILEYCSAALVHASKVDLYTKCVRVVQKFVGSSGSVWFVHDLYMLFHLLLLDVHISWIW